MMMISKQPIIVSDYGKSVLKVESMESLVSLEVMNLQEIGKKSVRDQERNMQSEK